MISYEKIFQGDRRTIARAISLVENDAAESAALLATIFRRTGKAYRIGITGPPGAGKSTLTNRLALQYRARNYRVGIIAVDPTSPFTGGALLGDRVRMADVEMDQGVFVRSMASRGSLGGLSKKTREAADILDASGMDVILMETVGVGQSELDIAGAADTTIVVLVPESGDGIQAMKAGLMEIADFFVLNKADRPGADQAVMSLKMILGFRPHDAKSWMTPVVKSVASAGTGIDEIMDAIDRHRSHLIQHGLFEERRARRMRDRILELVQDRLKKEFWNDARRHHLQEGVAASLRFESTPYDVAESLVAGSE